MGGPDNHGQFEKSCDAPPPRSGRRWLRLRRSRSRRGLLCFETLRRRGFEALLLATQACPLSLGCASTCCAALPLPLTRPDFIGGAAAAIVCTTQSAVFALASVAQLEEALDLGSRGCGFESHRSHQTVIPLEGGESAKLAPPGSNPGAVSSFASPIGLATRAAFASVAPLSLPARACAALMAAQTTR